MCLIKLLLRKFREDLLSELCLYSLYEGLNGVYVTVNRRNQELHVITNQFSKYL